MEQAVQGARADRRGPSLHTKAEQTERAAMQAEWVKASAGDLTTLCQVYPVTSKGVWLILRGASWKTCLTGTCPSLTNWNLNSKVSHLPGFLSLTWIAPTWVLSLPHPRLLSLLCLEDHFCFGNWAPCSWETTQNWRPTARDKRLSHNSGLPPWVSGPGRMTNRL